MGGQLPNGRVQQEVGPLGLSLADVLDNANDAIIVTDADHKIVGWNKQAEQIYGFRKEEVLGKSVVETLSPGCQGVRSARLKELLDRGGSLCGEFSHRTKNGREVRVHLSVKGLYDTAGQRLGFLGISSDISELKEKEERLRCQNRALRAFKEVASALSNPMATKEVLQRAIRTIVKAVSADAGAIFLLNGKGATFSPLVHNGASESLMEEIASYSVKGSFSGRIVEKGKGILIRDVRTLKGNSQVLPATKEAGFRSLMGVPLPGKKETLGTLEVACRSANRFKPCDLRLLEALASQVVGAVENAALREDLSKSLRSKTRLVREARHRVTNNLQAIASLLSTARESEEWTGDGTETIDSAVRRISGMAAIQQQMELDDGEAMELGDVMERIEVCLREIYGDRHEMTFDTHGSRVELSPSLANSLAMAINELVWNSCAHGFDPGQKGSVGVSASVINGVAKVEVRDNGKGIPESFDLDQDAHTGLSIVRNLVERDLNGKLTLCRKDGTSATITWPVASAPES